MKILVVNDDGINAPGIRILANALAEENDVTVVAPVTERSAAGHSYSFSVPINFEKTVKPEFNGIETFTSTGTPCDCVILGLDYLGRENVDLVVSGINAGANLGTDIPASGTVNAALEGVMHGVPSLAVSQEIKSLVSHDDYDKYYGYAAEYTAGFIKGYDFSDMDGYTISLDFPFTFDIKGLRVCRMGKSQNDFFYHAQQDFVGRTHYWVDVVRSPKQYNIDFETDEKWLEDGYIVMTPIRVDMTADSELERLKREFNVDF